MHLRFSFFQPSSHFSWDTHSKQSFHLDEEGFLWLSFCSFVPWSNSFDLYRTFHALKTSLSCICASYISLYAFFCFLFLILLLCLCFVCVKIQNHINSEKSKKFDRHCWVLSQNMFYLVPLCKWICASTNITCFLCTRIIMGEILKSMWLL